MYVCKHAHAVTRALSFHHVGLRLGLIPTEPSCQTHSISSFLLKKHFYVCVCVNLCHVYAGAQRPKEVMRAPETGVVRHLMWMLGTHDLSKSGASS